MSANAFFKKDHIILNEHAHNEKEIIQRLLDLYVYKDENSRQFTQTSIGESTIVYHVQDTCTTSSSILVWMDKQGIKVESCDQKLSHLFLMIVSSSQESHLETFSQLIQLFIKNHIESDILRAYTAQQFIDIFTGKINEQKVQKEIYDLVGITACPTGLVNTYLAAKSLVDQAQKMNLLMKIETHGASGIKNELTNEDISQAQGIIIASDKRIDTSRFQNKPVYMCSISEVMTNPKSVIEKARNQDSLLKEEVHQEIKKEPIKMENIIYHLIDQLSYGVSCIVPILMLNYMLLQICTYFSGSEMFYYNYSMNGLNSMNAFIFMCYYILTFISTGYVYSFGVVPIISAFIAKKIAGYYGFATALVSMIYFGLMSQHNSYDILIAILVGFLSGYIFLGIKKIIQKLPEIIESLIPDWMISILVSLFMIVLIHFMTYQNMYEQSYVYNLSEEIVPLPFAILCIIGLTISIIMSTNIKKMGFKLAFSIGVIALLLQRYQVMSIVMMIGMLLPLSIGISMILCPKLYTKDERQNKWKYIVQGLCFTNQESFFHFLENKKSIQKSCIISSIVAAVMCSYCECLQKFPVGGVWMIVFVDNFQYFILILIACIVINLSLIVLIKET